MPVLLLLAVLTVAGSVRLAVLGHRSRVLKAQREADAWAVLPHHTSWKELRRDRDGDLP